jgi:hypothetical protein
MEQTLGLSPHLREQKDIDIFEKMIEKISKHSGIDKEIIRKCGAKAIYKWEEEEEKNITSLFAMPPSGRNIQIRILVEYFEHYLEIVLLDNNILRNAIHITTRVLKEIFLYSCGPDWAFDN